MAIPRGIVAEHPALGDWCIISAWRGSIAHGMYDGPHKDSIDDKDTVAICVPPVDYYFGLREFGSRGTQEIKRDEWDIVVYEARKAVRMLAQGNPNIVSLLWLPENSYMLVTPAGRLLLDARELFVGQWCYQSFVGYAKGQFHKMTHGSTQGYMGEKRRALVERYGYDCKNASHLIRLLRMACEFLKTGELIVDRGGLDATELLDIKHGKWTLEQVQSEAERLFRRAEDAYDRCTLPARPDRDAISDLCVQVVSTAVGSRA
jgi:predicted nucleotidyltransferase